MEDFNNGGFHEVVRSRNKSRNEQLAEQKARFPVLNDPGWEALDYQYHGSVWFRKEIATAGDLTLAIGIAPNHSASYCWQLKGAGFGCAEGLGSVNEMSWTEAQAGAVAAANAQIEELGIELEPEDE